MLPFDIYELDLPCAVECWECSAADEIRTLMKSAEKFSGIQVEKEEGESTWEPVEDGWLCPDCYDEHRDRTDSSRIRR